MAGEEPRVRLAHMADAERVDEAVEVDLAALVDGAGQVPDAGRAIALAPLQHLGL
jgi:hypothetical protein